MESAGHFSAVTSASSAPAPARKLRKRTEFLRVAKGRRFFTPAFALQAASRLPAETVEPPGFGLTITKKTGNAVVRNRIRRRLRAALKCAPAIDAKPGCDYVIVARREALARPFTGLMTDIEQAVAAINVKLENKAPQSRS